MRTKAAVALLLAAAACGSFGTSGAASDGGLAEGGDDGGVVCPEEQARATNAKHCGRCNHDCLGGVCAAGQCQPVQVGEGLSFPWYLTQDATDVYVTSTVDGGVSRVAKTTGKTVQLSTRKSLGIAVDDQNIYFCDSTTTPPHNVMRMKKDGTNLTPFVPSDCTELVLRDHQLFLTGSYTAEVTRMNADGGAKVVLASMFVGADPQGIAVDEGSVYFAQHGANAISTVGRDGGAATKLDSGNNPRRLVVDDKAIYWVDYRSPQIHRIKKEGLVVSVIAHSAADVFEGGIAVDSTHVYWAVTHAMVGGIFRVPKDTTTDREGELVVKVAEPVDVMLDDVSIWFTMPRSHRLMRVAKP